MHNYFAECIFDLFKPGKADALYHIAAPSNVPLKPNPMRSNNYSFPRMYTTSNTLPSITGSSQQHVSQPSMMKMPQNSQNRSSRNVLNERDIPIRAFNPSVPILRGPRMPPPRGIPYAGQGPRAEGNRCIGCGITGHSTYDCPYGNYPFCYSCKRFGHIRAECRDEWVADLQGDRPMQQPPVIPPYIPKQAHRHQLP